MNLTMAGAGQPKKAEIRDSGDPSAARFQANAGCLSPTGVSPTGTINPARPGLF